MAIPMLRPFNTNKHFLFLTSFASQRAYTIHKTKTIIRCAPSNVSNPISSEAGVCLSVGTHLIPHPDKVEKGGEDAFFVSGGVLAVADGVSGWAEKDVNPALFSRELMANVSSLVKDEEVYYDPRNLIRKAHDATSAIGSATAVVAMLEKNGTLKIANVGDCGLRVVRKGQIVFSTSPQEHYFDCPYQLSSEAIGQTFLDATALAKLAHEHSKDSSFDSPYSQEARTQGFDVPWWKKFMGMKLTGGKLDDITVIVGQVKSLMSS